MNFHRKRDKMGRMDEENFYTPRAIKRQGLSQKVQPSSGENLGVFYIKKGSHKAGFPL